MSQGTQNGREHMRIELTPDQIQTDDPANNQGIEIGVAGFQHDPTANDDNPTQVFIEVRNGMLAVHIWDGTSEDPVTHKIIGLQ